MSQQIQVVLFIKGKGSDGASFRPRRDDTQWWNRRDALVRCVAAFLFGPQQHHNDNTDNDNHNDNSGEKHAFVTTSRKKSLVLLFDEDWARIHLELVARRQEQQQQHDDVDDEYTPMEKNIIQLLKRAAEAVPGTTVRDRALQATMSLSPNMLLLAASINKSSSNNNLPSSLDSKRAILEYMQKTCSIEFLRENGLNSSMAAVLKKTNKKVLTAVWRTWVDQQQQAIMSKSKVKESSSSSDTTTNTTKQSLLPLLAEILKPNIHYPNHSTVAGILHESGDAELPVWDQLPSTLSNDQHHRIVLFLGAVRDMTRLENDCLVQLCRQQSIPLVKIRLGRVPEFTSKILSVVAFHAARGMLLPAIKHLLPTSSNGNAAASRKRARSVGGDGEDDQLHQQQRTTPSHLKVVCFVPMDSKELLTDLDTRSRLLWSIVRCSVVTLWRSKIHGKEGDSSPLMNELVLLFEDGITLSLHQKDLVSDLAEQHQAAPCEFQILSALQKRVQEQKNNTRDQSVSVDWSKQAKQLVKRIRKESNEPYRVISVAPRDNHYLNDSVRDFGRCFYATSGEAARHATYILLQTLGRPSDSSKAFTAAFQKALAKKKCQAVEGFFADACVDPALPIAMMQHFAYQGRLEEMFTKVKSV